MESQMSCSMSDMWSLKMPKGLDLEISHHPLTMRRVVNLIVAMERLKSHKSSESVQGTEFREENLLNIMLESIVEEKIVLERSAAPSEFSRRGMHLCTMTDSQKRSLVQNSMELHAVMLQGGSTDRKVHLNMSTYVPPTTPSTNAWPVALGIKDTDLYLSCHKDGGNPTLCLEEVTNKDSLRQIGSQSEMVRFLFYKQDTGVNNSTLMSARYPNWYISTAEENNKPVEMCQETARRHRTFNIERQS
ncbi:interleukin-1 beta-like [Parambassis ranga]|uniref:Interleukin-1 n=1 Tax=Parambassis ranga TaxID=210632 RepID=A0A6P7IYI1_9TELE|nr:interleukin-1 beta-like [Parambassis ranga]